MYLSQTKNQRPIRLDVAHTFIVRKVVFFFSIYLSCIFLKASMAARWTSHLHRSRFWNGCEWWTGTFPGDIIRAFLSRSCQFRWYYTYHYHRRNLTDNSRVRKLWIDHKPTAGVLLSPPSPPPLHYMFDNNTSREGEEWHVLNLGVH